MKYNKKRSHIILSVLEKGFVSCEDYNSTKEPFFYQNRKKRFEIEPNIDIDIPDKINKNINYNIKIIYNLLGNNKKEFYLGEWTIFSLENALSQYKIYCDNGQTNVFNIGFRYLGMGYIELVCCDLKSHRLFYHTDGGSNDWDRQSNFNDIINNGSNKKEKFYFSDWFNYIDNN